MIVCVGEPLPQDNKRKIKKRVTVQGEIKRLVFKGSKILKRFYDDCVVFQYDDGRQDIW
jgi:hypothetical protein